MVGREEGMTPSISFIIPAYNCAKFVEEAVLSIQDGNFEEGDELVITDDGSTDATASILRELQARYPSIKLLKHDANKGISAARNTAIVAAKNALIFNLDADNALVPGSVSKLKAYLLRTDADVAAFGEIHFFKNNVSRVTHHWVYKSGVISLADCLTGRRTPLGNGNYLFTKESWVRAGGYPEFARTYEAVGFGWRQVATGAKIVVMPKSFYFHRYGYASNWVREGGPRQASRLLLKVLRPFFDLLIPEDVEYIMSHKDQWYADLRKRPIRVK